MLPLVALDDGLAGPEAAVGLRGLDDAEREAVLDRAERVERLELHVELDALRLQRLDPDHRRVADGLEDARPDPGADGSPHG